MIRNPLTMYTSHLMEMMHTKESEKGGIELVISMQEYIKSYIKVIIH